MTPDELKQQFEDLAFGIDDHDGLSLADVVHAIIGDVLDSARLAMSTLDDPVAGSPTYVEFTRRDNILQTVSDYYFNHYGDL